MPEAAQEAPWLLAGASFFMACATSWLACGTYVGMARRYGWGQPVRSDGPKTHLAKTGTPTMGGVAFMPAVLVVATAAVLAGPAAAGEQELLWPVLMAGAGMALIGLADDLWKILAGKTRGIRARWRILAELVVGGVAVYLASHAWGSEAPGTGWLGVGGLGEPWAFIIRLCCVVGCANAVNFTDGVDGLAGSLVCLASLTLGVFGLLVGAGAIGAALAATAGGCVGFLRYNWQPAKLFMGDVGSLGLGGLLGAAAVALRVEVLFILLGAIFVWETLSVILQVVSFRLTGKRLFRMSPFHHHLELCGWSESAIVLAAVVVQAVLGAAAMMLFVSFGGAAKL